MGSQRSLAIIIWDDEVLELWYVGRSRERV